MSVKHRSAFSWLTAIWMATVIITFPLSSQAEEFFQLPDGSKVDLSQKCPVCEMEVGGKDQQGVTLTFKEGRLVGFHGVAAAVFKDGHVVGFDGARCLFVYNSVPQKYNVNVSDIAHQYVTDYTTKKMIELPNAFLVLGSEVKGLMGYELVPFSNREDAGKFASENEGKWIVQLHEVARAVPKEAETSTPPAQREILGRDEKAPPVPAQEPGASQLQQRPVEKARKRPPVPQRFKEPEPFYGGFGHHGGGHHGH